MFTSNKLLFVALIVCTSCLLLVIQPVLGSKNSNSQKLHRIFSGKSQQQQQHFDLDNEEYHTVTSALELAAVTKTLQEYDGAKCECTVTLKQTAENVPVSTRLDVSCKSTTGRSSFIPVCGCGDISVQCTEAGESSSATYFGEYRNNYCGSALPLTTSACSGLACLNNGRQNIRSNVITTTVESGVSTQTCYSTFIRTACTTSAPCSCQISCGDWGSCSATCGSASQSRQCQVLVPPSNGGTPCPELNQIQACSLSPCPIDCVVSQDWTDWSGCSTTCGAGIQSRVKSILIPPQFGGAQCPATLENRPCEPMNPACASNCVLGEWGAWGQCSVSCGNGMQSRSRPILTPAANGGTCADTTETQPCQGAVCPVDCQVSDWEIVGSCSKTCGGGTVLQHRRIITPAVGTGAACPVLQREIPCNSQPCAVNCQYSEWSTPSSCTTSCGDGTTTRIRSILQEGAHGGVLCTEPLILEEPCNLGACPVHCQLSQWSDWTICSHSCGGGSQTRTRDVVIAAQHGGNACDEQLVQSQICAVDPCPIDCAVSEYGNWSTCSVSCGGGVQSRTRSVVTASQNGGQACPTLSDSRVCNADACPPIDCVVSEWSDYSPCNSACDGQQQRQRVVVSNAINGGTCNVQLLESRACNVGLCQDCKASEWSAFTECSKSCGGGIQTRTRNITQPGGANAVCPPLYEEVACNAQPCPVDCSVSEWSAWGECSATCGGGTMQRTRTVTQVATNGGAVCPSLVQQMECNSFPCPNDCIMSEWGNWSTCSLTCGGGMSERSRTVVRAASHGGAACGALSEGMECNVHPCPVDCVLSPWSEWSQCSATCGVAHRQRIRQVITPAAFGGKCSSVLTEIEPCEQSDCPTQCQVSDWSVWGACSSSCGGGIRSRTRNVLVQPTHGAAPCPSVTQYDECGVEPCPVHCELSQWSNFSACSVDIDGPKCGSGTMTRTRQVVTAPSNNGTACGELTETVPCMSAYGLCPVDCKVSDWGTFTECSLPCGGGVRTRERKVVTPAANGGEPCPSLVQNAECNITPCPIDCQLSDWGTWSTCSASCGGGTQYRNRTILREPSADGSQCGALSVSRPCNAQPCPVDCQLSDWSAWSACSASCGTGVSQRSRTVITPSQNGGKLCENLVETQQCNTEQCSKQCVMSQWSNFSSCSKSCGDGLKQRVRVAANGNNRECPPEYQTITCNEGACPQDCVMSEWSPFTPCSTSCGVGYQTSFRSIVKPALFGGVACGPTQRTMSCNRSSCSCSISCACTSCSCTPCSA